MTSFKGNLIKNHMLTVIRPYKLKLWLLIESVLFVVFSVNHTQSFNTESFLGQAETSSTMLMLQLNQDIRSV